MVASSYTNNSSAINGSVIRSNNNSLTGYDERPTSFFFVPQDLDYVHHTRQDEYLYSTPRRNSNRSYVNQPSSYEKPKVKAVGMCCPKELVLLDQSTTDVNRPSQLLPLSPTGTTNSPLSKRSTGTHSARNKNVGMKIKKVWSAEEFVSSLLHNSSYER